MLMKLNVCKLLSLSLLLVVGVAGAAEEAQELYCPAICKAIADLGYKGFFAHEYTPTKDALPTLKKMLKTCEV